MLPVLVHTDGPIRIVEINRPEVRNAVDAKTAELLYRTFVDIDQDPDVKCVIL
jgi:enoyl-CoA hydratase/carnithine racemase